MAHHAGRVFAIGRVGPAPARHFDCSMRIPPANGVRIQGGDEMIKWLTAALLCAMSTTAGAQVFTGRIDVTVRDSTGAVLPGVTVSAGGPQNQNTVTDAQGEAHFLNLPAGAYEVCWGGSTTSARRSSTRLQRS